jgi:hypothetical protein
MSLGGFSMHIDKGLHFQDILDVLMAGGSVEYWDYVTNEWIEYDYDHSISLVFAMETKWRKNGTPILPYL